MSFNELARKRYSCRKLAAKPVEQEKLDAIYYTYEITPTKSIISATLTSLR